jgi:starch synthase
MYAGADAFLMPSLFEPCGQSQMIAMRYGTPPIVRFTGGLVDTVIDADYQPDTGNGFGFGPAEPAALVEAVGRALAAYADRDRWAAIQQRAMATDFSWRGPAAEYVAAYRRLLDLR